MLQFGDILNKVDDPDKRELLLERLELVAHKIKFMDAVPVALSDSDNSLNYVLSSYLEPAGGYVVGNFEAAVYVVYYEESEDLNSLMQKVPGHLSPEWEAYKNNRIAMLNANAYDLSNAEQEVQLVEDIAEILHPGVFVFGQEGGNWIRFGG